MSYKRQNFVDNATVLRAEHLDHIEDGIVEIDVRTQGYVTPEMFGAVGDGVTDDTEAIQTAVAQKGVIRFLPKTYKITNVIAVSSDTLLVGNNAVILKPSQDTGHRVFSVVDVENVIIDGFKVQAEAYSKSNDPNNADDMEVYSNAYGFRIQDSHNIIVRNVTLNDCMYGFMIVGASDVKINSCRIDGDILDADGTERGGTFYGMYITQSNEIYVSNTYIAVSKRGNNHHHDIYIGADCHKIYFDHCKFRAKGKEPVSFKQGTSKRTTNEDGTPTDDAKPSTDICIMNSSFRCIGGIAYIDNGGETIFQNCDIRTTSTSYAFRSVYDSTITLSNNHVHCSQGIVLGFDNGGNFKVFDNYFKCLRILSANHTRTINCDIGNCVFDCDKALGESTNYALLYLNNTGGGDGKVRVTNNVINMYNYMKNDFPININNANIALNVYGNTFISDTQRTALMHNQTSQISTYYNNLAIGFSNFAISSDVGTSDGNVVVQA